MKFNEHGTIWTVFLIVVAVLAIGLVAVSVQDEDWVNAGIGALLAVLAIVRLIMLRQHRRRTP